MCYAVEDGEHQELRSDDRGVGFAVEDRPGKLVNYSSWLLI